ncbi:hypothetical protein [Thioalkalivibrio paradoxus]|uniref:hypothetical protein n=1 Tax=Thioalkalivibrio paradoxus TaxID=108010 RepID=UPI000A07650E|nr:hypothetical protein [Thioalkalivibrio paradoxus]
MADDGLRPLPPYLAVAICRAEKRSVIRRSARAETRTSVPLPTPGWRMADDGLRPLPPYSGDSCGAANASLSRCSRRAGGACRRSGRPASRSRRGTI